MGLFPDEVLFSQESIGPEQVAAAPYCLGFIQVP